MGLGKKIGIGLGIAVAAFFGLVIAAALTIPNPQTDNPITTSAISDAPAITPTQAETQQQKVRVYDLSFSIVNATQNGRAITVIVIVENHGSQIELVSWLDFRLIDGEKNLYEDSRPFPPDSGTLPAMGEIAPSGSKAFRYVFAVPEGTQITDCQLVVTEDSRNLKYLDLA